MADKPNITPARALETVRCNFPSASSELRDDFRDMLKSLAHHVRLEEYFARTELRGVVSLIVAGESVRACRAVGDAARRVCDLPRVLPGDKALGLAAALVELAAVMEDPAERVRLHKVIAYAPACLLLEEDALGAMVTNPLLNTAFTWLDRLVALECAGAQPSSFDDPEAMLVPAL
ncbi:MAG TPA: hypothetical protein GX696_03015 [Pseudomonadaceae bacterium]|nr:hypothetical protein [Pseudomonadaceae bacterium]